MRTARMLATGLLLGAVVTGCTKSPSDPGVATAESGGATPKPSASVSSSPDPVRYAKCMREHGMTWYPDPVDAAGNLGKVKPPAGVDKAKLSAAEDACRAYSSGADGPQPASAADKAKMLEFAQCMRANGLSTFPDPEEEGGFSLGGTGLNPQSPTFQAAQKKCASLMPEPPGGKNKAVPPGGSGNA